MTRTFASFQRRAPSAVAASVHSAARAPRTLLAAIEAPVPVQQKRTAVSTAPVATSSPTVEADLGPLLVGPGRRPDEPDLVTPRHEVRGDGVGERGLLVGARTRRARRDATPS